MLKFGHFSFCWLTHFYSQPWRAIQFPAMFDALILVTFFGFYFSGNFGRSRFRFLWINTRTVLFLFFTKLLSFSISPFLKKKKSVLNYSCYVQAMHHCQEQKVGWGLWTSTGESVFALWSCLYWPFSRQHIHKSR